MSTYRMVWSLTLAWITYACLTGWGGEDKECGGVRVWLGDGCGAGGGGRVGLNFPFSLRRLRQFVRVAWHINLVSGSVCVCVCVSEVCRTV